MEDIWMWKYDSKEKTNMIKSQPTPKLRIVYHGTGKEAARAIRKQGFKPHTQFATNLADSLGYGGEYIFEVMIPEDLIPENAWQFIVGQKVPARSIVSLKRYQIEKYYNNEVQRALVLKSNMDPRELRDLCQHIKAHPEDYSPVEREVFQETNEGES